MLLSTLIITIDLVILFSLILVSLIDLFYFKKTGIHIITSFNSTISIFFLIMGIVTLVLMSFFSNSALTYFMVALPFFLGASFSAERYQKGK